MEDAWLEVLPNILSITSAHTEKTIHIRFIPASKPGQDVSMWRLATMMGAIDGGFRVIFVTDALCSSTNENHDAMMTVYLNRFGEQVETDATETLLESWQGTPQRKVA